MLKLTLKSNAVQISILLLLYISFYFIVNQKFIDSNMVSVLCTICLGVLLYLLWLKIPILIDVLAYYYSTGIIIGFLFNIGEVYLYSAYYKRGYFFFGDGITSPMVLAYLYACLSQKKVLSILTAAALLMSGTKISLVLMILSMGGLLIAHHKYTFKLLIKIYLISILAGLTIYGAALLVGSLQPSSPGLKKFISSTYQLACPLRVPVESYKVRNFYHKSNTQILEGIFLTPLQYRFLSSIAGLWMTLEGGFWGERYPAQRQEFADLMMENNPWGVNDRFDVTWNTWKKIGRPQNPYLCFGSAYGPWILGLVIMGLLGLVFMALLNLFHGEKGPPSTFSVYFIVMILFNQTQPWICPGDRLFIVLSFCATHILLSYLSRRHLLPEAINQNLLNCSR